MTKYERELAVAEERLKREANIRVLQYEIDERKNILAVIPKGSFDAQKERQFIQEQISHYSELLDDERRAYDAASSSTDSETDNVAQRMLDSPD